MIIVISGSVGSGKTSISKELSKKLSYDVVHLNDKAKIFKLNDDESVQTFDFDLDKLLVNVEKEIKLLKENGKNVIFESHFAHFINPDLIDMLFVINRDLKDLKKEYIKRKYNDKKIKDNLEVESFNLCFYEAIEEGYGEEVEDLKNLNKINDSKTKVFSIENNGSIDLVIEKIIKIIEDY